MASSRGRSRRREDVDAVGESHISAVSQGSSSGSSSSSSSSEGPLPTYSYLVFKHVLALLPTIIFLITFAILSFKQRCRLPIRQRKDEDSRLSNAHCNRILGPFSELGWSFFLLGITGYAAVHKVRSLIGKVSKLSLKLWRYLSSKKKKSTASSSRTSTMLTCALGAAFTEAFRIPLLVTAIAIVLAQVTLRNHNRQQRNTSSMHTSTTLPEQLQWAAMLDSRDARFRIAVWVALGWATAGFLTTSVKLLHNLSLYAPVYLDDNDDDEDTHGVIGRPHPTLDEEEEEEDEDDPRTPRTPHNETNRATSSAQRIAAAIHRDDWEEADSIYRGQVPENNRPAEDKIAHPSPLKLNSASASRSQSTTGRRRRPNASQDYFGVDAHDHADVQPNTSAVSIPEEMNVIAQLEDQVDRLVAARRRVKLEQVLGASLPELPSTLAALWRIDDALWSVGSILLMASAVAIGQGPILSTSAGTGNEEPLFDVSKHHGGKDHYTKEDTATMWPDTSAVLPTYVVLVTLHWGFNSVFALALPTWGWPTVTYSSLLVGIAIMVLGLARWGLVM
ncbi:unnamed protein product [Sympodiomycopsis kandeliae]